jgi:hypothetical protein
VGNVEKERFLLQNFFSLEKKTKDFLKLFSCNIFIVAIGGAFYEE